MQHQVGVAVLVATFLRVRELDCGTGDFAGTATEGFYGLLKGCSGVPIDIPGVNCVITDKSDPDYVPWTVTLTGSYAGTLDAATDTITGSWSLVPDIGGSCDGSFTVMYTHSASDVELVRA